MESEVEEEGRGGGESNPDRGNRREESPGFKEDHRSNKTLGMAH